MKKRPTILDVARSAGVTDGTVSRALHNDKRVHPDTRARILKVAQELGYIPNLSARHFKRGKTQNIGILCDSGSWMLYSSFFGRLIAGVADAANEEGYRLVLYLPEEGPLPPVTNPDQIPVHLRGISELEDGRVDVAIIVGGRRSVRESLESLKKIHLPVVLMGNNVPEPGFIQLLSGASERAYLATQTLIRRTGSVPAHLGLYEGSTHNLASEAGWRDAVLQAKLQANEELLYSFKTWNISEPKELLVRAQRALAAGAKSMICSDLTQVRRLMDMRNDGSLAMPADFLFAAFGSSGDPEGIKQNSVVYIESDLLLAGRRAFNLAKKALLSEAPETQSVDWHYAS